MKKHTFCGQPVYLNAQAAFEDYYNVIMASGIDTPVGTKALYNEGFYILRPEDNIINTPWRKWKKDYADAEWDWYLSGNRSVEEIKKLAKIWDTMHNGDNLVNSNYGWQWQRNNQLDECIAQLKKNKATRQAWISIYDGKEKNSYSFDTPCTIGIGFNVHPLDPTSLNMSVIMRSNDLVYGFCNDQYCFSRLQKMVADKVGLQVGTYFHFAQDLHIYKKHFNMKKNYEKDI